MTDVADNPFLDTTDDIEMRSGGNLPHWHQNGKIQYVTFRLADSLPQTKIRELNELTSNFEHCHPKPWDEATKLEYSKLLGPVEERLLHNGYGRCVLRNECCRKILSEAIKKCDRINYRVIAYVIMPNHVHLLIQLYGDNKLEKIMHSIKRHSARKINELLGFSGTLWLKESFDRLGRSDDHLKHCISYIKSNPRGFPPEEYELYLGG
ncbi:MAG: transposase [Paramuribaculum sp.]|nr:transposase [Paramuribaculum sp.]